MGNCNEQVGGNFTCCEPDVYVQDKVCNDFTIIAATPVVVYITNVNTNELFATGSITFSSGTGVLLVNFLLGTTILGPTLTLTPGSSASFTVTNFSAVQLTAAGATALTPVIGEFCITPRYELN
ncbi:DUF3992 domain-containing protein [Aneurinibacillus terranovensis]|uniref:DUF3992 domain-containing protein n=1 Tax=Aneurinibacillus terranovensis TaxID=278991 RepID=UPI000687D3A3|nr:S-Ena type endospore appendage [Aneurinibacillus terranovensis]